MTRPYELDVYAARNRERAYGAVVTAIEDASPPVTRKAIAEATGRKPPQISMTLSGPSNWTLDTVSDLLRPIRATMQYTVVYDVDQPRSNIFNSINTQVIDGGTTATPGNPTQSSAASTNGTSTLVNLLTAAATR